MRVRLIIFLVVVCGLLLSTFVVDDPGWTWALLVAGVAAAVVAEVILLAGPFGARARGPR